MIAPPSMHNPAGFFLRATALDFLRALAAALVALAGAPAAAAPYYGNTPTPFAWIDPVADAHTAATWTSGANSYPWAGRSGSPTKIIP